jgi:transposase InsO family protein
MGLQGVIRGKPVKTTVSDKSAPCPLDRVNRQFFAPAPNMLWLSDFTYVATWQGFVYVAFVIDAFARRIVGWRASRTARAGFVLDALDQALHDRRAVKRGGLVHHSDRGSQYVSIRSMGKVNHKSDRTKSRFRIAATRFSTTVAFTSKL